MKEERGKREKESNDFQRRQGRGDDSAEEVDGSLSHSHTLFSAEASALRWMCGAKFVGSYSYYELGRTSRTSSALC